MGTISGSGVANVVASGQFTIPLMKRFGYKSAFAGGVEATASMGGQIMPPVMGAVAFIMAETIDVPYVEDRQGRDHSGAPLFRSACSGGASRSGQARPASACREIELAERLAALRREMVSRRCRSAVLVYLLFAGYTPLFAGSVGLALTVLLILGTARSPLGLGTPGPAASSSGSGSALLAAALRCALGVTLVAARRRGPDRLCLNAVLRGGPRDARWPAATRSPTVRARPCRSVSPAPSSASSSAP